MKSMTKIILVLLALGQPGCTNVGQTGSNSQAQPQGGLSPEIRQRIEAYQRGRHPWQQVSPDAFLLQRQLFELRHRLIASGQAVQTDTRQHRQVLENLVLDVTVPAMHVCGQELEIKVSLQNRGPTPMRLLTWDDAFNVQVAHESGHIVREPPAVRAAITAPRPEHYRTLAAGESFVRELKLRHLPPNLPPGLYHVEVVYHTRAWGDQKDTVEGSAGSPVRETSFVLGREAGGLRASLRLDESGGVDEHGAPVFLATLEDTADHEIMLMPWAGTLVFRDVQTGKEIEFSQTIADPEGLPPRDPRGYPIRLSYRTLRPGEEVTLRIRPQATFDGQTTRYWRDVLVPGRRYEVRWHYHNDTGWLIEGGQFLQWSKVWMGRLGSAPLGFTLSEAQEVEQETAETQPAARQALEKIKTPVELPASGLLGLTEADVLKKEGLDKLNPEPGETDKKWHSGGIMEFPPQSGYVWSRCHILTFKGGKVVKHEIVDRPTAHISRLPPEP